MFKKFLLFILPALSIPAIHAQTVAYVANNQSNNVSVIDTATKTVATTIPVGTHPSGVVFSPDGGRVYVLNSGDGTISVIDTATNTVTATIPVGGAGVDGPELLAITPDGKSVYAANELGSVFVVDTDTSSLVATVPVPGADAIFITPDGSHAYVQTVFTDGTSVIDTASNTVIASIPSSSGFSTGIAGTPDGVNIYATGGFLVPSISVIATSSNTVVGSIPCAGGPQGIAFTPDGSKAYVTNELTNAVDVLDANTNTVEPATIAVGNDPVLVALTPDGAFAYVSNFGFGTGSTVSVIDTSTNTVVTTLNVGSAPEAIAIAHLAAPFAAFTVEDLDTNEHKVSLEGDFTLGAHSGGIDLAHQPLTLAIGSFSLTIPAGSFRQEGGRHHFEFHGTINGLRVDFDLNTEHHNSIAFDYQAKIKGVDLVTPDRVTVGLKIGHNVGTTHVDVRELHRERR